MSAIQGGLDSPGAIHYPRYQFPQPYYQVVTQSNDPYFTPVITTFFVPSLADTSTSFRQLLAAEQTAQSVQAWIQGKKDEIRMIKQQAVDQELEDIAIYDEVKRLEEDIGVLKRLLESNETSRHRWRRLHGVAWRGTVRPPQVGDLPQEILTMIFAHFEDVPEPQIQIDAFPSDECLPHPDTATIKNMRLTCRAFCEVGSRFLLPVVDILFTRSCLKRLKEISNHPTISKGVRILRIHTNAYGAWLAIDRDHFCDRIAQELRSIPIRFGAQAMVTRQKVAEDCRLVGLIPKPNFFKIRGLEMLLKEAEDLHDIVQKLKRRNPQAAVPLDPFETKISKAVVRAHEEYQRRYFEQEILAQDARICIKVTTAIGLMPSVQRLCITGSCNRQGRRPFDNLYAPQKYKSAITSRNPFRKMMVRPGVDTLLHWDGDPPFSLVLKLPLMLQAGSRNLTHLDIELPPVPYCSTNILVEYLQSLRHACQQLKVVQIRIARSTRSWVVRASLATTYTVLEAMLVSPELEVIKLDLVSGLTTEFFLDPATSVGSLLEALDWNKLQAVHLAYVSIKLEELRQLLSQVLEKVQLDLTGIYLLDGTWVEALEILRGPAGSSSRVVDPRGVEIEGMAPREAEYLTHEFYSEYRESHYSFQRCPGPASYYIRGGNIPNPLIWVDG